MDAEKMFSKAKADRLALEWESHSKPFSRILPKDQREMEEEDRPDCLWDALESLDVLDRWASSNADEPIPNSPIGLNDDEECGHLDPDKWLENHVDEWNKRRWEKYVSPDLNLSGLHANIQALESLLEKGTKLKTLGVACLREITEELDKMLVPVLNTSNTSNQEFDLILGLMCICSKLALRIQEYGVIQEVETVIEFCITKAEAVTQNREKYGGISPLNQGSPLFTIYCNASSIYLNLGNRSEAQRTIECALAVMDSTHADLDTFLLNQASIFVAEGNTTAARQSINKAVTIAQEGFNSVTLIAERMHIELEKISCDLSNARNRGCGLPQTGTVFYVGCQQGDISFKEETEIMLEDEAAAKRNDFDAQQEKVIAQKLKLMRCYRKLGNFHKGLPGKQNLEIVHNCASKLSQLGQSNLDEIPVHDAIGHATFLADYHFLCAKFFQKSDRKKECFTAVLDVCYPVIQKIRKQYGENHSFERAAEIFEKGSIAMMLLKRSPEEILDLTASAVRIRSMHNQTPSFFLARSLVLLSQAFAYAGDFKKAIQVAKEGERICVRLFGDMHFKTRQMRQVQGDHKKMFMKVLLMRHARQSPSNLVVQKISHGSWIDEWIY